MAAILAGSIFAIVAIAMIAVTFFSLIANGEAAATGGNAGGVSFLPPLLALASGALSIWLFLS